ncbi:MAG: hypothetical protein H0U73_08525 [Tatlockia sp.]|nr:hypothetical protein [Tatlockia sp.]
MKLIMTVIGLLISGLISAKTLDTPHYKIIINCQNSKIEHCDKASYEETNKETGATLNLAGKQISKACEGASNCNSLGYEFTNGNVIYYISENGQLQVIDGGKVLLDESGTWID